MKITQDEINANNNLKKQVKAFEEFKKIKVTNINNINTWKYDDSITKLFEDMRNKISK